MVCFMIIADLGAMSLLCYCLGTFELLMTAYVHRVCSEQCWNHTQYLRFILQLEFGEFHHCAFKVHSFSLYLIMVWFIGINSWYSILLVSNREIQATFIFPFFCSELQYSVLHCSFKGSIKLKFSFLKECYRYYCEQFIQACFFVCFVFWHSQNVITGPLQII